MKTLAAVFLCVFALTLRGADKINIAVPASYTGDTAVSRQPLVLTPINPLPRTYSTNVFSRQPISRYTDTNGLCTFSNILWGYYRLDIPGNPGTAFNLVVGTNLSGTVNIVPLITNSATLPPNPSTNYYTQAQVDALIAGISGGGGSGTGIATNAGTGFTNTFFQPTLKQTNGATYVSQAFSGVDRIVYGDQSGEQSHYVIRTGGSQDSYWWNPDLQFKWLTFSSHDPGLYFNGTNIWFEYDNVADTNHIWFSNANVVVTGPIESRTGFTGNGSGLTNLVKSSYVGSIQTNQVRSASETNNVIPWWPAVWWGDSLTASATSSRIQWSEMTGRTNIDKGFTGETSLQIRNRALDATNDWTTNMTAVIWVGRNDFSQNTMNATNQVLTNIAAIAARQLNGRFFVIQNMNGYISGPTGPETIGTTNYTHHTNLWAMLSSTYSNRFIRVRDFLVEWGAASAVAQDNTDAANGIIPTSLTIGDGVHLTEAGYGLAAHYIMTNINWTEGQLWERPATHHDIMTAFRTPPALGPVTITTPSSNYPVVQVFDTNGYSQLAIRVGGTATARNLFIGDESGTNTTGLRNVGAGQFALQKIKTGSDNTAIGYQAARESTNSNDITAVGSSAARAAYSGSSIVAVGKNAAEFNTTASGNVALGYGAIRLNTISAGLVGVGYQSLYNNTGANNAGIGYNSLYSTTSGIGNNAFGYTALYANITGQYNIGIGFSPGYNSGATAENSTNDTYSIYIGYLAGRDASIAGTAVANSIALGKNAKVTASGQMQIGAAGADAISIITHSNLAVSGKISAGFNGTGYYGLIGSGNVTNAAGSRVAYLTDIGGGGETNLVRVLQIGSDAAGQSATNFNIVSVSNLLEWIEDVNYPGSGSNITLNFQFGGGRLLLTNNACVTTINGLSSNVWKHTYQLMTSQNANGTWTLYFHTNLANFQGGTNGIFPIATNAGAENTFYLETSYFGTNVNVGQGVNWKKL